jgi:murein DD-endopeptidase MepM/ murein hydrolase activator NlpD
VVRGRTLPEGMTGKSKTCVRRGSAFLVLTCMLASQSLSASASINDRINQQRSQIHQTHESLNQNRQQLHDIQVRESQLRDSLSQTQDSIGDANSRIRDLQGQINSNQRKQAWTQVQLQAAKNTLALHNAALRRRLVDAYENGSMGYLQVLFSARSFAEFVERWEDIRLLVAANQRTIRERKEAERRVAEVESDLLNQGAVLDEQHARAQRQHQQLLALEQTRSNLVAVEDSLRTRTSNTVVELEESSSEEENSLQSLIVQKQREEQAELEAARAAARRAAQLAGSSMPVDSSPGAPGDLTWPVSGPITSPFGMRLDPVSGEFTRMHTGIDIGAPQGATIAAAASGRVLIAGWTDGGYGNMVVIDNGGGLSTLYAHCSQVFVTAGQSVQRGQAIAAVGTTGHSTGPHLHFEVRMNGQPVDPTNRLR